MANLAKIKIFQRDCCRYATGAKVSLLDGNENVIASHRIGDVSNESWFEINVSDFIESSNFCWCWFSGGLPGPLPTYSPGHSSTDDGSGGSGRVEKSYGNINDGSCYKYDVVSNNSKHLRIHSFPVLC